MYAFTHTYRNFKWVRIHDEFVCHLLHSKYIAWPAINALIRSCMIISSSSRLGHENFLMRWVEHLHCTYSLDTRVSTKIDTIWTVASYMRFKTKNCRICGEISLFCANFRLYAKKFLRRICEKQIHVQNIRMMKLIFLILKFFDEEIRKVLR